MNVALFPGSFDPITYGHVDIIKRAIRIFDRIIVAVGDNVRKQYLFSVQERMQMVREAIEPWQEVVRVERLEGLVVDKARKLKVDVVIRALRAVTDFQFEFEMALTNRILDPEFETVFFMPSREYTYLSSSMAKEIAGFGGDVSPFVPPGVERRLREKLISTSIPAQ